MANLLFSDVKKSFSQAERGILLAFTKKIENFDHIPIWGEPRNSSRLEGFWVLGKTAQDEGLLQVYATMRTGQDEATFLRMVDESVSRFTAIKRSAISKIIGPNFVGCIGALTFYNDCKLLWTNQRFRSADVEIVMRAMRLG